MDKAYIKTLLDNLDCCTLERLTWFETGAEAVYRDGKLLCSDGDASTGKAPTLPKESSQSLIWFSSEAATWERPCTILQCFRVWT